MDDGPILSRLVLRSVAVRGTAVFSVPTEDPRRGGGVAVEDERAGREGRREGGRAACVSAEDSRRGGRGRQALSYVLDDEGASCEGVLRIAGTAEDVDDERRVLEGAK